MIRSLQEELIFITKHTHGSVERSNVKERQRERSTQDRSSSGENGFVYKEKTSVDERQALPVSDVFQGIVKKTSQNKRFRLKR